MRQNLWTAALAVMLIGSVADAYEWRVPEDARSLRAALRRAQPGDSIVLSGARLRAPLTIRSPGVTIVGNGALLRGGRRGRPVLRVRASGVTLRGLRLVNGGVRIDGDNVTLDDVRIRDTGQAAAVSARGDGVRIVDSQIGRATYKTTRRNVVDVLGDRAELTRVEFGGATWTRARPGPLGAFDVACIRGNDAVMTGNSVATGNGARAFHVVGDDATVRDNSAADCPDGVLIEGDRATVTGNRVEDGFGIAIEVLGDDGTANKNVLERRTGDGITFRGERATATGNAITMGEYVVPTPDTTRIKVPRSEYGGTTKQTVPIPWDVTPGCPAIVVVENTTGALISGNNIDYSIGTGVHVEGDQVVIEENVFTATDVGATAVVGVGSGLVVQDNEIHVNDMGAVAISGPGAVVRGNEFTGGQTDAPVIAITGQDARIRDNDVLAPFERALSVDGDGAIVESNVFQMPLLAEQMLGVIVSVIGDGRVFADNVMTAHDGGETIFSFDCFYIEGDDASVERNVIESIATHHYRVDRYNLTVRGNGATVAENTIHSPHGRGIGVTGDDNAICDNRLLEPGPPQYRGSGAEGVYVVGDRNRIERNEITAASSDGLVVRGNDNDITDTRVTDPKGSGVRVDGNDNSVTDTTLVDMYADGFEIRGDRNVVERASAERARRIGVSVAGDGNSVRDVVLTDPALGGWSTGTSGIRVTGSANLIEDCTIGGSGSNGVELRGSGNELVRVEIDACAATGVRVEYGARNSMVDCSAVGNALCGLENMAGQTSVTRGRYTGNGIADVLEAAPFDAFDDVEFTSRTVDF